MKILKIISFIIFLVLIFYIIFIVFFKKEVVAPDKFNKIEQNQIFRGPVGEPYIKGPTNPYPSN